jgi:predicted nucleotidyltransferase
MLPDHAAQMRQLCEAHGVLTLYFFGSRADDGLRIASGRAVERGGADLDVGVVFARSPHDPLELTKLQTSLDDLLAPLRVDLVPLQRVDPLFQFEAISGHRVECLDGTRADEFELEVMRHASELLSVQRRLDIDLFGVSNR